MIQIKGSITEIAKRGYDLLMEQGAGAYDGNSCVYYCEHTGNRCLFGLLVTPDEAKAMEEQYPESSITDVENVEFPDLAEWEMDMLTGLQNIHDNVAEGFDAEFKDGLASQYDTFLRTVEIINERDWKARNSI